MVGRFVYGIVGLGTSGLSLSIKSSKWLRESSAFPGAGGRWRISDMIDQLLDSAIILPCALDRGACLRHYRFARPFGFDLSTSSGETIRLFGEQTRKLIGDFEGYLAGWFEGRIGRGQFVGRIVGFVRVRMNGWFNGFVDGVLTVSRRSRSWLEVALQILGNVASGILTALLLKILLGIRMVAVNRTCRSDQLLANEFHFHIFS